MSEMYNVYSLIVLQLINSLDDRRRKTINQSLHGYVYGPHMCIHYWRTTLLRSNSVKARH